MQRLSLYLSVCLLISFSCCAETGSTLTQKEADAVVEFFNKARKAVNVPPVKWSVDIAKYAQAWADQCAKTGEVAHRPPSGDWAEKYGENIACGNGPKGSLTVALDGWYAEIKLYQPGEVIPQDMSTFGAGHYTQMVWKDTTQIGAGRAAIKTGKYKGWTITVCNCDPAGNIIGEKPYEK